MIWWYNRRTKSAHAVRDGEETTLCKHGVLRTDKVWRKAEETDHKCGLCRRMLRRKK